MIPIDQYILEHYYDTLGEAIRSERVMLRISPKFLGTFPTPISEINSSNAWSLFLES